MQVKDKDGEIHEVEKIVQIHDSAPVQSEINIDLTNAMEYAGEIDAMTEAGYTPYGFCNLGGDNGEGAKITVSVGGAEQDIDLNQDMEIKGEYGTLTFNTNGQGLFSYHYKADDAVVGKETFTFSMTDSDGDKNNATLNIDLKFTDDFDPSMAQPLDPGLPPFGDVSGEIPDGIAVLDKALAVEDETEAENEQVVTDEENAAGVTEDDGESLKHPVENAESEIPALDEAEIQDDASVDESEAGSDDVNRNETIGQTDEVSIRTARNESFGTEGDPEIEDAVADENAESVNGKIEDENSEPAAGDIEEEPANGVTGGNSGQPNAGMPENQEDAMHGNESEDDPDMLDDAFGIGDEDHENPYDIDFGEVGNASHQSVRPEIPEDEDLGGTDGSEESNIYIEDTQAEKELVEGFNKTFGGDEKEDEAPSITEPVREVMGTRADAEPVSVRETVEAAVSVPDFSDFNDVAPIENDITTEIAMAHAEVA